MGISIEIDSNPFRSDLNALINRYSKENGSHTPDWILGEYLERCLETFDAVTTMRDNWHRFVPRFAEPSFGEVSS